MVTEADVVVTGHEHKGFGVIHYNGKLFINVGALGRVDASTTEYTRTPQYAHIKVFKDRCEAAAFPVQCALPGDQVLDREAILVEEARKQRLQQFETTLTNGNVLVANLEDIVQEVSRSIVKDDVKREVLSRLQKAQIDRE